MSFSVDFFSKICYNKLRSRCLMVHICPNQVDPTRYSQKKMGPNLLFWLTSPPKDRIIIVYTGARDGAHQKKSSDKTIQPQKNFVTQRLGRTLT